MKLKNYFAAAILASAISSNAQPAKITVDVAHPSHPISPTLWGIFFEDINLSADGGIYPELVRNRSFEDADVMEFWKFSSAHGGHSEASVITSDVHAQPPPLNAFNRKSLRVKVDGGFRLENDGYWGMNFVEGESYTLKFAARVEKGFNPHITFFNSNIERDGTNARFAAEIVSGTRVISSGSLDLKKFSEKWTYYTIDLPSAWLSEPKGKLVLSGDGKGVLFLDMVSLMPKKTWKNHGLRSDLAESLDALHPKFMRFPGGCWVEGDDFAHMNHWKKTVGDIDVREPLWNIWGYNATHGLGYHEYLQLAEDLGATPLFDINCGMSHKENAPMDRMNEWVQDALDAVEYANGPTNSVWGALRARNGHPAPFHLKYLEVGNENGGPAYRERWPLIVNAVHAKYPEIKFIANEWAGGHPSSPVPDVVDEHYYETPESFMRRATMYDKYDRNGPKIFVGEYAVTQHAGKGNLRAALGEAAMMTGMERNSDVVILASYAPLLVNLDHRAWNPDLINFNTAAWYGLPSYYVQKLFAENRGDLSLPTSVDSPMADSAPQGGMVGVGTWNTAAEFKDVKVTAPDGKVLFASDFAKNSDGWKKLGDGAQWSVENGMLKQSAEREFIRALAGDKSWTDYTLTLKARKISGAEGFLILFRIGDNEDRTWWNLGGWNNTQDGIESAGTIDGKPGHIETDRWYDIKVTVTGKSAKCWLDGELVHDVQLDEVGKVNSLYSVAATDKATGDLIVKVVNASTQPLETVINLNGANLIGSGTATVLTSESGADENSIDAPTKVLPKTESVNFSGTTLKRSFPGNSFTVLRLNSK